MYIRLFSAQTSDAPCRVYTCFTVAHAPSSPFFLFYYRSQDRHRARARVHAYVVYMYMRAKGKKEEEEGEEREREREDRREEAPVKAPRGYKRRPVFRMQCGQEWNLNANGFCCCVF